MDGEKWAEESLLAKPCPPPDPSRKTLISVFQQPFVEGRCLSRPLPGLSCSPLALGCAGVEHPGSPCEWQASGRGVMAMEDLNLSALLMTSAGISMGEFLFSWSAFEEDPSLRISYKTL